MSPEAERLLEQATTAAAPSDLLPAPGRAAPLADALVELWAEAELAPLPAEALWNLLWLSAELTVEADVYRAVRLVDGVATAFARGLATAEGERAQAAEMAFDFLFARPAQPLLAFRLEATLAALGRVLALPGRTAARAALHGLAHAKPRLREPERLRVDALIDAFLLRNELPSLAVYAARARAGDLP